MAPVDDIETYCDNGIWKTRWRNSPQPFATGGGNQRQVTKGATVAQWYGVDHITNPDGTTAEHNSYRYRREAHTTGDLDAITDHSAAGSAPLVEL
ncbi:hypothetical protein [Kribbella sp.]|uniref:hypothetical protein n=1 Tax=Kribbella sp. TaxID=1871183 RepID=UPI002D6D9248|nr:hypothetical protein [Kribbella sp.]HZX05007.1 hypothetical protein [Kribbella sp.]